MLKVESQKTSKISYNICNQVGDVNRSIDWNERKKSSANILLHYRYQNCRRIRRYGCSPVRVRSPASALACAFRAVWISYISKKSEFKIWCGIRLLNFNRISFWAPCGNQSSIRASQYVAFDDPPPSHTHTHIHIHIHIRRPTRRAPSSDRFCHWPLFLCELYAII